VSSGKAFSTRSTPTGTATQSVLSYPGDLVVATAQNRRVTTRSTPPELPTHAEVLAALSVAIDLGLGQPAEHMLRSALIATRLADRLGLPRGQRDCIYYATLIMWIGCHADSHEYARWFGDDIAVRRGSYLVDFSGLPYQRFLLTNIGHGESLLQRLKTMTTLYVNARGHISKLIHSHCTSAALLAERIGLDSDVQTALRYTFERFDGGGLPNGVPGEEIPIEMRVAQLADMVEVHQREYGTDGAVAMVRSRRGGQFDPGVVDAFVEDAERILAIPATGDVWAMALQNAPDRQTALDAPALDALLVALGDFVDLKCPFTLGHSRATAQLAGDAAVAVGVERGHAEDDRVGEGAQRQRRLAARHVQRDGRCAAGQDEVPVGVALAAGGDDFLVGQVDVFGGDAAVQLDVVADKPAGVVQVELGVPAAQIGLAQRGLGIGQGGVAGQNADGDMRMPAAERLRRAQTCRTTADGDEAWCHHTSWVPLRGAR
jgi:HD domain